MRALLCSCKDRLRASDNEALFRVVLDHLSDYHPAVRIDEEELGEAIAVHSYELTELVVVGAEPDKEFGIDPY
jgi:hypothetical protein